jgi:hypothetical protein
VDLADRFENHIPVWATEIGGCAETGDGVLLCIGVVDHDVCCVVDADFSCEVLYPNQQNILSGGRNELTVWISIA